MSIQVMGAFQARSKVRRPLFLSAVQAGFPSPAEDYVDRKLDLNELCVRNPAATFFVRVAGESMVEAGINDGDILVVDRSLEAKHGDVVIAVIDGELTVKRLEKRAGRFVLVPANSDFAVIELDEGSDCEVWGVVRWSLHGVG